MKKNGLFILFFVLFCNSNWILAQTEPEEIKTDSDKFQELFYESLLQKGIENYDKAITSLEQCLNLKQNESIVHFELGKNYLASKKYPQSYTSFEKAAQLDPKNKWFWMGMYDASYEAKNYQQAFVPIQKLIEFDMVYKEDLTELYMNTKQFDKALSLINELNETIGKSKRRNDYKTLILSQKGIQNTDNDIVVAGKSNDIEAAYKDKIRLYIENGEANKAFEMAQKLNAIVPNSSWANAASFKYYLDNHDNQKAIQSLNVALKSDEVATVVKHKLFNHFLNFAEKNPQFEPDLVNAIGYFENDTTIAVAKEVGKYFQSKQQFDKAIRFYLLNQKNSATPDMETNLLLLESYIQTKQFDLVSKNATSMMEIFPSQPQFYYYAGMSNNQLKQFKKAKEALEIGLDFVINDTKLEVSYNLQLAEAYNGLGDFKKKETYFAKANQLLKNKK